MKSISHRKVNLNFAVIIAILALAAFASPAFAAAGGGTLTVGQTMLADVISYLKTTAIAVCTVAMIFVGYRMMFAAAQWKDVAPVFWGAALIGAAAGVANIIAT